MLDPAPIDPVPIDAAPVEPANSELPPIACEEIKPRIWTVFLAFAAALGGAIVFQSIAFAMLGSWLAVRGVPLKDVAEQLPKSLGTVQMFLLMASCGQLAMVTTFLTAANLSPHPWRERLGLLPARSSAIVNVQAAVGSLVPLFIGFAFAAALGSILPVDPTVQTLFEGMSPIGWAVFILFIATVPAVVEEILFRGFMQRRLLERWRPLGAIGVTSLLFALMHVMPQAIVALFPLSIWLGVVAWRTGSVYPSMLCHAFINGSVNIWRAFVAQSGISETVQGIVVSIILLGSLACFVLACREMFQRTLVAEATTAEPSALQDMPTTA